jgi:hypothetical protein
MVCAPIGKSPQGLAYQESEFSHALNAYYLRADWIIEWLIRHTPAPLIAFGSILDSQFTDDLLSRFEGAKAIWVYRRYEDMANSSARKKWTDHLKNLARWVSLGELEKLGSRGKRISADTVVSSVSFFARLSTGSCLSLLVQPISSTSTSASTRIRRVDR